MKGFMQTRTIEVRVNKRHSDELASEAQANESVMNTLRKAGIPVVGTVSIRSVTKGALTISTEAHEYVYTWVSPVAATKTKDEDLL